MKPETLAALISQERFRTYVDAAGNPDGAVALYRWNARISGAFAELLHHVEIFVRNAMHNELTAYHATVDGRPAGAKWFDEPSWVVHHWFSNPARKNLRAAIDIAGHARSTPRPGKVVSELSFGFWRYLTSGRYEQSLWAPAIDHAFAAPGSRVQERRIAVEGHLAPLHQLRNRIAHCEPIFGTITYRGRRRPAATKSLENLRDDAVELIAWVSGAAATWIKEDVDQVSRLLAARPTG